MTPEIIRFDSLPVSPWRNGAGRKADIASAAGWHVGFAWLDADAPFSDFTGQDRTITLIDGAGFALAFADQPDLLVAAPYRPSGFDGGWPTQCRLLGGPSVVLNAMTARGRYRHHVGLGNTIDVAGIQRPATEAFFLVLLTGTAIVADNVELGPRDAIRMDRPLALHASEGSCACTIAIERLG